MYVCMYECIYVCMYVRMCVCISLYNESKGVNTLGYVYVCMKCMHVSMHVCMHVIVDESKGICICMHVFVCT